MSMKLQWSTYRDSPRFGKKISPNVSDYWLARLREAFYAGANAALEECESTRQCVEVQMEVEEFTRKLN